MNKSSFISGVVFFSLSHFAGHLALAVAPQCKAIAEAGQTRFAFSGKESAELKLDLERYSHFLLGVCEEIAKESSPHSDTQGVDRRESKLNYLKSYALEYKTAVEGFQILAKRIADQKLAASAYVPNGNSRLQKKWDTNQALMEKLFGRGGGLADPSKMNSEIIRLARIQPSEWVYFENGIASVNQAFQARIKYLSETIQSNASVLTNNGVLFDESSNSATRWLARTKASMKSLGGNGGKSALLQDEEDPASDGDASDQDLRVSGGQKHAKPKAGRFSRSGGDASGASSAAGD